MLKNLLKMLTSKKVLVVLAILAVIGGGFLFMKSKKALEIQSDVDEEVAVSDMIESNMRATIDVEDETKELSQAPQPMPEVDETLAMIE